MELDEPYYGADVSTDTDPDHVELLCAIQAEADEDSWAQESPLYTQSAEEKYESVLQSVGAAPMESSLEAVQRDEVRHSRLLTVMDKQDKKRQIAERGIPTAEVGDMQQDLQARDALSKKSEERRRSRSRSRSRSISRRRRMHTPPGVKSQSGSASDSSNSGFTIDPWNVVPKSQRRRSASPEDSMVEEEGRKGHRRSSSSSSTRSVAEEGGKGKTIVRDMRSSGSVYLLF